MISPYVVLAALTLAVVTPAMGQTEAKADQSKEQHFVHSVQLDGYRITYLDAGGQQVSFDRFMAASAGTTFSMNKDMDAHTAVMRIDAVGGAPHAASTADLQSLVGHALPAMQLSMLPQATGGMFDTGKLLGHYTLISSFFSTCTPCIAEVPVLNAYARQHLDLQLLSVTFDSAGDAQAFVKKRGLQWPVAYQAGDWLHTVGIKTYPTLMLIDPKGKLVATRVGFTLAPDQNGQQAALIELTQWVNGYRGRYIF